MTLIEQKWRYESDPEFRALVEMMEKQLMSGTYSISELKAAANLASMRVSAKEILPKAQWGPTTVNMNEGEIDEAKGVPNL